MAERTRIISIVGKKNCGKTTMVVALAMEFGRRGYAVATLKHGTHPANLDAEGTDTWRHFHQGKAQRTLIESPEGRVYFERTESQADPIALAQRFMLGTDIIIAEGFSDSDLPKIEVFRSAVHDKPRYDSALPNADRWVAMLADQKIVGVPFPQFRFSDTAWLVAISALAWDEATLL